MDYKELGFKSGLEIHQQLDTKKLFCRCPSLLRKDNPDYEIKRKLHLVAGESGAVDEAAKYQHALDKTFVYQGYDETCLVELDEEPPHHINQEALRIALQVALLLHCKILPLTQIMRKTVIDGSNTSGFQRTVFIARDGYVETKDGKVGIESICLEEDAARIIQKEDDMVVYRLDRLGIPLIEIATAPEIKSPSQAKEVALHIGDVLRSCKVKRGLGTIRQDVNLSIKKGKRIELKGVQNPDIIVPAIDTEIQRQLGLLEKGEKPSAEVRNVLSDGSTEFLRPMPGAARMYPETDLPLLKIKKQLIDEVKKTLPRLRSDVEGDLKKKGLSQELIKLLFKRDKLEEFKSLLLIVNNPLLVAKVLLLFPKDIALKNNLSLDDVDERLPNSTLKDVLRSFTQKKIDENNLKLVLEGILSGKTLSEVIKELQSFDKSSLEEAILRIIKERPGLNPNAYMGLVMKQFKGKVSGKEVMDILSRLLE